MKKIIEFLQQSRDRNLEDLKAYLRYPSISSDPQQADALRNCAQFTASLLRNAQLENVTVHEIAGPPVVTGSWCHAPNRPTVLIYGHYDVQPVDPLPLWQHDPFAPHIEAERIFARGAADDKGQILMHIHAVGAILKSTGSLPINVRFLIEGEEEIGSPHLPDFLEKHAQELRADMGLISDSSMWAEGVPAITTSLRGLVLLDITVVGPNRDLHSGSYGGAIGNPLEALARMLAMVKNQEGRILIPGYYDHVENISPELKKRLCALPFDENAYISQLGVEQTWGEEGFSTLERIWLRPTFEINGLWGGFNGPGSKTVLPSEAHAKISMRLVPKQNPDEIIKITSDYLLAIAPPWVKVKIDRIPGGGPAATVPADFPALAAAQQALQESFQHEAFFIGEGGTIPVVAHMSDILKIKTILIGFALPDSKQHAPNENFHLPTFHTGTESLIRLFHYL